jgi:hypothetical protein
MIYPCILLILFSYLNYKMFMITKSKRKVERVVPRAETLNNGEIKRHQINFRKIATCSLAASHSSFAHFRKLYIPVSAWHRTGLSITNGKLIPLSEKRYQFPARHTKWLENGKLRRAILSVFYNISQRNVGILLILWCSFKLWWHFCLDLSRSKFCSLGNRSIVV